MRKIVKRGVKNIKGMNNLCAEAFILYFLSFWYYQFTDQHPAGIDLFKANKEHTTKMCEIYSE